MRELLFSHLLSQKFDNVKGEENKTMGGGIGGETTCDCLDLDEEKGGV